MAKEVGIPETTSTARRSTMQLILVPAIITLAVTILRLAGELQHWPKPWFSTSAGGGGAIIGIVCLPIIFGPYFALKLTDSGERTKGVGKGIGLAILGMIVLFGGAFVAFGPTLKFPVKTILGIPLMIVAAWLQFPAWPALGRTLLAYAFAAPIPVALVMFFAIRGNRGTHYDALPPGYTGPMDLWGKYFEIALIPQLVFWIVFTLFFGSLFGQIAAALARRGKEAIQTAS